ncbi:cytochrome c biogenesis protein ResB [Oikeobacillus pervagus]|uniref:Cytochrome c biogenesis protein ResB n=1 Tax=Oikeobacillus pervagus TaxID=1325931 RepID=A0AAJ1SX25_9BACI|nr:hypothetical protein [Oikeobacillus pervagus]MDQ0214373.1 cytochrome c biogenesis protein ResB [Oikeobacillus pervagus]
MKWAILLVVLVCIFSIFGTLMAAKKQEKNYGQSTARNVKNLSIIYIFLFIALILGVILYAVAIY